MTLNEVTALIVGWANDRNLLEGSNYKQQCLKLVEELGETADAAELRDYAGMLDGVGDCYVVASIISAQLGSSIIIERERHVRQHSTALGAVGLVCAAAARSKEQACLEAVACFINTLEREAAAEGIALLDAALSAWETIKDRKGRMVDGVFIKEEDLPAEEPVKEVKNAKKK